MMSKKDFLEMVDKNKNIQNKWVDDIVFDFKSLIEYTCSNESSSKLSDFKVPSLIEEKVGFKSPLPTLAEYKKISKQIKKTLMEQYPFRLFTMSAFGDFINIGREGDNRLVSGIIFRASFKNRDVDKNKKWFYEMCDHTRMVAEGRKIVESFNYQIKAATKTEGSFSFDINKDDDDYLINFVDEKLFSEYVNVLNLSYERKKYTLIVKWSVRNE